jgi:hypothetical protein
MLKGSVDRNFATLRTSDQDRRLVISKGVDHGHQVCNRWRGLLLALRLTEASPVIGDCHIARTDGIQLSLPHAAVTNVSVQEDDRTTLADHLRRQHGTAGCDLMLREHIFSSDFTCNLIQEMAVAIYLLIGLQVYMGLLFVIKLRFCVWAHLAAGLLLVADVAHAQEGRRECFKPSRSGS